MPTLSKMHMWMTKEALLLRHIAAMQEASPGSRGTCTGKDMKACAQARPKLVICTVKRQVTESLAGSTASL